MKGINEKIFGWSIFPVVLLVSIGIWALIYTCAKSVYCHSDIARDSVENQAICKYSDNSEKVKTVQDENSKE